MKKWLARLGWVVLSLLVVMLIGLMTWEPLFATRGTAPKATDYRAEIIRDEFGVPHIYGDTDADVAFGVAIAHAQDDFFTLQDVVAMSRGRYGAIAGEDGAAVDYVYHLLDARGTARRQFTSLPADTQALFNAYAAGLNQYAAEHPAELKLGSLFPVNGEDVAAGFALRQPFFFGLNNIIQPLVAGEPMRPEYGPAITPANPQQPGPLPVGEDGALAGSNAFAVSAEKSGEATTRLVSNAHQPWRGGVAWYELVVESGEGWHFAGANFPGSPYPFLGHNENLGWTNTVNRPDLVDVYKLEMDESGKNYRLDGKWLPLEEKSVRLAVRYGPVSVPVWMTVYHSKHGPVIKNDNGFYAIRYAGIDDLGQLDAYYRLNKAKDLAEWTSIMARMDVPSTNFIYADAADNIAYIYNASFPKRKVGPDWRGILPGDDSSLIWTEKADFADVPQYLNPSSGWVFNANNNPFKAAGPGSDLSPDSVAPELGVELNSTNRARRAWKLMSEAATIDRQTLEAIKYDQAYERAGYVDQMLDEIAALSLRKGTLEHRAQRLLGTWDLTADNVGRADALALLILREYMSAEYQNKLEQPSPEGQLGDAARHLMTHFGRLDPPMSQVLRLRQGEVDLPLDGGSDTLRASTTWDVDDDGRLSVKHGDSFVMFVEWEQGKPVRSQSIQPFGSATTRPDSPHYSDQSTLFIQHRLKPVHFWRVDAERNAVSRKTVTSR
ncbi:acylase [Allopontixanthobacter sediminis]|uniref:Acylase n=1 Tax=Allopontixanthobacter sediminis TaxID=1689985 RepID=A0A845B430_9SPHN|nr:acylase [Allopontixanthobacter sediminis]MXP45128.1 acylase [Allopontixanthobacter sediminis]